MIEKRIVKTVTIEFDNGETRTHFDINGKYNCSKNWRNGVDGTWHEYYISWFIPDQPEETLEETEEEKEEYGQEKAWCSVHSCNPSKCFSIHYPNAFSK
jgi:hypothetical protein